MNFSRKVVLITGAGSGIGEATAMAFAKSSAKLSLFDKKDGYLTRVSKICERFNDNQVLKCIVDVTKYEDLQKAVEDTLSKFGRIDIFVNCAGIVELGNIVDSNLMEAYDRAANVNTRAAVCLTNLIAPSLIKSKGNIVIVTSISSKTVNLGWMPYSVSKAALSHFAKCIALELARKGVRVNTIQPGPTKTNILNNCRTFDSNNNDETWKRLGENTPLGHYVDASEVADLIVYVASDKAKSITGGEYSIDSGLLLGGEVKLDL